MAKHRHRMTGGKKKPRNTNIFKAFTKFIEVPPQGFEP